MFCEKVVNNCFLSILWLLVGLLLGDSKVYSEQNDEIIANSCKAYSKLACRQKMHVLNVFSSTFVCCVRKISHETDFNESHTSNH